MWKCKYCNDWQGPLWLAPPAANIAAAHYTHKHSHCRPTDRPQLLQLANRLDYHQLLSTHSYKISQNHPYLVSQAKDASYGLFSFVQAFKRDTVTKRKCCQQTRRFREDRNVLSFLTFFFLLFFLFDSESHQANIQHLKCLLLHWLDMFLAIWHCPRPHLYSLSLIHSVCNTYTFPVALQNRTLLECLLRHLHSSPP